MHKELNANQLQTLQLVDEGFTQPEIAAKLNYSTHTVRWWLNGIYSIFGMLDGKPSGGRRKSRQAVRIAKERGLI